MRLPKALWRRISPAKVEQYLLNLDHPDGGGKARYFRAFGFHGDEAETLMAALYDHPTRNNVAQTIQTPYGMKHIVRCEIETPDQRNPCIVSVWVVEANGKPRLITAYPA